MSPAKTALNHNKPLRDQVVTALGSDWWKQFLLLVRAELVETNMTAEQASGCRLYENTLLTMTDEDWVAPESLSSGLNHDIDSPTKERKLATKQPMPETLIAPAPGAPIPMPVRH